MRDLQDPFHIALSAFSAFLCDCVIFFVSEFFPHTLVGIYNLLFFGSDSSKYLTLHLSKTSYAAHFSLRGSRDSKPDGRPPGFILLHLFPFPFAD